ncbi:MAG: nitroreductase [Clostridia bacterium]|nr:nitroreductase [Clostridia bacterium]
MTDKLCERRSVKAYKETPVPKEVLERIIKAGTYAPTGRNLQSPIIIAVTDKQMRDKLSCMNKEILGTDTDPFYGAPAVLVVLAKKDVNTYLYDGSLVMGNLLNAAHFEGFGACWIHRAKEMFETKEGKDILLSLGITEEYEGIGNCIIGYPKGEVISKPRKDKYVYYI